MYGVLCANALPMSAAVRKVIKNHNIFLFYFVNLRACTLNRHPVEDFKLKVFTAVAETGSFTAAARLLGISQPAVSQNIAELEKFAGAKLFNRDRSMVTLTDKGRVFRMYADKIIYWYAEAEKMFLSANSVTENAALHIAASEDLISTILPEVLAVLKSSMPDIHLDLRLLRDGRFNDVPSLASPRPDTGAAAEVSYRAPDIVFDSCLAGPSYSRADTLSEEESANPVLSWSGHFPVCLAVPESNKLYLTGLRELQNIESQSVAAWSTLLSAQLPPEILSRISFESDSVETVKKFMSLSSVTMGLLPEYSVRGETGMRSVYRLENLSVEVKMTTSADFAQKKICRLLCRQLADFCI